MGLRFYKLLSTIYYLGSGDGLLDEVVLHVSLEVEVGELLAVLDVKKAGELGIGVDKTTVGLVLEVVGADVGVDLLAHTSAGELSANWLAKELGKLITDTSGLGEAGWLAVGIDSLALAAR